MGGIWLSLGGQSTVPKHLPLLLPGFRDFNELPIGEIIRVKPVPNAARAAEIRNSRLSANPSAGEDYYSPGVNNQVSYSVGKSVQIVLFQVFNPFLMTALKTGKV